MYESKSSGPRMEPWKTPPWISTHEECFPLKTTICFLLLSYKSSCLVTVA